MIRIVKETDVYLAIEETGKLAKNIGFDHAMVLKIKTAVSELARNIIKYASRGRVEISPISEKKRGIEIRVIDIGPGIKDIDMAVQDNFSSGGTLGLGLPGVKRLMDEFEIDSIPDKGTKIMVKKWLK